MALGKAERRLVRTQIDPDDGHAGVGRPDALCDLGAALAFDDGEVVLTLQVEPEFRRLPK